MNIDCIKYLMGFKKHRELKSITVYINQEELKGVKYFKVLELSKS